VRLKNHTTLADDWLRAVIRAVRPSGISGFDVRISNCSGAFRGRAYTKGSSYHDRADPFIVVSIAKTDKGAQAILKGGNGYLPMTIGSRKEAALVVIAHELRHLWQSTHTRGRVWGSKGRMSERDADAYALQMLRQYRRGELAI